MGRFVDIGKGDKDRTSDRKAYLDNMERLFGNKRPRAGSFKRDAETGEFIPSHEWHHKYGKKTFGRAPYVRGDIEPYQSPIDDSVITSRRAQRYDLERSGCRIYEGREAEQREADRHKAYKWEKLEKTLDSSIQQVANDLKYQNIQKETRIKSSWLMGED